MVYLPTHFENSSIPQINFLTDDHFSFSLSSQNSAILTQNHSLFQAARL